MPGCESCGCEVLVNRNVGRTANKFVSQKALMTTDPTMKTTKPEKLKREFKVLIAAAECAPFVKVGGLADVIGSLPKALYGLGVDVRVVIPYYKELKISNLKSQISKPISNLKTKFGGTEEVAVYESTLPDSEVPIYFLENEKYLSGGGIYFSKDAVAGSQEEIQRFAFFSKAVAEFASDQFDIIHCNDWHTGLVPGLLRSEGRGQGAEDRSRGQKTENRERIRLLSSVFEYPSSVFRPPSSVFTIHNLANQGFADLVETRYASSLHKFLNSITSESELLKWDAEDDNLDLMLQGITAADVVSTVSPTYAKEILTPEFGEGLHQVLKAREARLCGILNGIDYQVWNPETDLKIEFNYGIQEGLAGKVANKIYLQKELGLVVNPEVPLIGMVNRLTEQKGLDLVLDTLDKILSFGAQLVILGVGDENYERELGIRNKELRGEGNFVFVNRFDEDLAHKIYAAADLFLMPSRFEPCGLVQIMAMRYGALPIVRATGGLKDTVENGQTGFVFEEYSAEALLEAIERAVGRFGVENVQFRQMIARAMRADFSWERSAKEYLQLYRKALEYREAEVF